ncbi:Mechanosensitive ion channel [Halorubrum aquaticum]|uniref:Mechanosensitive ion channel n=1 Tax=Halorubrum aquaticum TaxID=387340 RepID=A0A1I3C0T5_9EURY|nr:mechanosensitive ion channel domain-containing protein [Halorubrum aquaticum]SFH68144.1 Mechanosensitive ion channel [Halorubrum aquaticum]
MGPAIAVVLGGAIASTAEPGPEGLVDYWPVLTRAGWFIAGFLVVTFLGWVLVEPMVSRAIHRRNRNNPTLREAISRYLRLLVLVVAFLVGAGVAGYGDLIADSALVVAAATLAVGVAAQTVIGSLVSGTVLVVDPEFNVGNYIEWETGEGTVESITLRITRVRTQDGGLVTVPNTVLTEQAIERPYARDRSRMTDRVDLAYDDDVGEAIRVLETAVDGIEGVLEEPAPHAYVEEFGGDAVGVRIHYWVDDPRDRDLFELRSRYARAAKSGLESAGVTISPASKRDLRGRIEVERTE